LRHLYPDLNDSDFQSSIALFHQRYSTNTFPMWYTAQPFRMLAHNGEINTLAGNVNWMRMREETLRSPLFGDAFADLLPVIQEGGSDSAMLDNVLELLVQCGRSPVQAMALLVPEAYESHKTMDPKLRAYYDYNRTLMEPWDGACVRGSLATHKCACRAVPFLRNPTVLATTTRPSPRTRRPRGAVLY